MDKLNKKINIMLGCLLLTNLLLLYAIASGNSTILHTKKNAAHATHLSLSDETLAAHPKAETSRYAIKIVLFDFK